MKGLIKKDLLNLSSYKTTLLIIIIFCSFGIVGTESITMAPIVICTIIGMISLSAFNYDESSKSDKFILSLPITKKEIVLSKYILAISSIIIGGLLGIILTILIANILNIIRPSDLISIDYQNLFISTLGGMFGIALIQSIQIPSIYKWGAEKGRIQMFIIIFAIILLIIVLSLLATKFNISINMGQIEQFLNKYGILILILSMIIMYSISYNISTKIYLKKDY